MKGWLHTVLALSLVAVAAPTAVAASPTDDLGEVFEDSRAQDDRNPCVQIYLPQTPPFAVNPDCIPDIGLANDACFDVFEQTPAFNVDLDCIPEGQIAANPCVQLHRGQFPPIVIDPDCIRNHDHDL